MKKKTVFLLILILFSTSLFSYEKETLEKMIDSTIWLMPPSLKGFLNTYKKYLLEGAIETIKKEERTPTEELCKKLNNEIKDLPSFTVKQPTFESIAYRFGVLAGITYLLNDPLREDKSEEVEKIKTDYKYYINRILKKLILTFDGYDNPEFLGESCEYFNNRQMVFEKYVANILFSYYKDGTLVSSSTFDDKSNAFGCAQIILSRSVSDAAKVWLFVWEKMDGDLSDTPYLKKKEKKDEKNKN